MQRNTEVSAMQGTLTEDAIRERAYRLWEADGRRDGCDVHYWYLAIELLNDEAQLSKRISEAIATSTAAGRKKSTGAKNAVSATSGAANKRAVPHRCIKEKSAGAAKATKKPEGKTAGGSVTFTTASREKAVG